MNYPISRKKYLKVISIHRKATFILWFIFGAGLLYMTPKSIVLPITFGQIAGMLLTYMFYASFVLITRKNHIVPRLPLLKTLRFGDQRIAVYNHRGKVLQEIQYNQINAIEIRELTMDWATNRSNVFFIKEKCILLYHNGASSLEDLKDVKLDFGENKEIYSTIKIFNCPKCVACMYDEKIFWEITQRMPNRTVRWF